MPPDFKNMTNAEIEAYINKKVKEGVGKNRQGDQSQERFSRTLKDLYEGQNKELGSMADLVGTIQKRFELVRDTIQSVGKEGALFVRGGPLATGLEQSAKELDELLGNAAKGAASFTSLMASVKNFGQLAEATADAQGGLSASLAKQAGILNELGLSYGQFSKNIDFAIYSMGQNQQAVEGFNFSIVELSKQIKMLPEDVSRNFQLVAKNMAYNFAGIKEQFVGIQRLSAETGVSLDALVGQFGKRMDTISGASEMAARLNSLLGANAFSATELLMMTEEQRMTSIRERLIGADVAKTALGGGVQGKFALQSVQEVLGLSLDDTRRFLQEGGLKADIAGQVREDFGGGLGGDATMNRFTNETENAATALTKFSDIVLNLMSPIEETIIRSRGEVIKNLGTLARIGALKSMGEVSADVQKAAFESPEFGRLVQVFQADEKRAAATLGIDRNELSRLAQGVSQGDPSAISKVQEALRRPAARGGLNEIQIQALRMTPEGFGIRRALANLFRRGRTPEQEGFTVVDGTVQSLSEEEVEGLKEKFQGTTTEKAETGVTAPSAAQRAAFAPMETTRVINVYIGQDKIETVVQRQIEKLK